MGVGILIGQPYLLKSLPVEDRPRERMVNQGQYALSNVELIALLLRTGSNGQSVMQLAQKVLAKVGGLKGLREVSCHELIQIHGVGMAKAVQLLAGIELGSRVKQPLQDGRLFIKTPEDVVQYVKDELQMKNQEHFVCMFLNTKNMISINPL